MLLGSIAFQESEGLVVLEAEHGQRSNGATHNWLYLSALSGYTGTSYLQPSLDNNTLISTNNLTTSPQIDYPLNITRPATYTVWLRGYAPDAAGDSAYIQLAGNTLSMTDAEDQTNSSSYDKLNRVIRTTNALSGTTTITYDALGNRLSVTNANNRTTTYQYDALNRLTRTTDPNSLTTITAYDGPGNRLSVTNGANETTEFEYDEANRLILTRDPLGNETEYGYDGAGSRIARIDAETIETCYGYDALNRLESVVENYADGVYTDGVTDEDVKTEHRYDAVGNRTQSIDANSQTTTYAYDALNRRVEGRDPLGNATLTGYNAIGSRTVITDANGAVTRFVYDAANRLTAIDYPPSTGSGQAQTDVTFTYDKAGHRP